jgi:hypothetical protein
MPVCFALAARGYRASSDLVLSRMLPLAYLRGIEEGDRFDRKSRGYGSYSMPQGTLA